MPPADVVACKVHRTPQPCRCGFRYPLPLQCGILLLRYAGIGAGPWFANPTHYMAALRWWLNVHNNPCPPRPSPLPHLHVIAVYSQCPLRFPTTASIIVGRQAFLSARKPENTLKRPTATNARILLSSYPRAVLSHVTHITIGNLLPRDRQSALNCLSTSHHEGRCPPIRSASRPRIRRPRACFLRCAITSNEVRITRVLRVAKVRARRGRRSRIRAHRESPQRHRVLRGSRAICRH